jgi:NTE family protein
MKKSFFLILFFMYLLLPKLQAQQKLNYILSHLQETDGEIRVGLVLGGGGAKGLAHIGVIKVLEEEGIKVDYVGGTSMGGLVGGLYALGNDAESMDSIVDQMDWDKLLNDQLTRLDLPMDEKADVNRYLLTLPLIGFIPNLPRGLVNGQLIKNELSKLAWAANDIFDFSLLPIPFFCVGTDIETGKAVTMDKGRLASALRATMSIPTIFEPVMYKNHLLVDGGLVNNYPVDIMRKKGMNFIIGVNVGNDLMKKNEITNAMDVLEQSTAFYGAIQLRANIKATDLYIRPDISGLSVLDFSNSDEIIRRGEEAARRKITQIRMLAKYLKKQHKKLTPKPRLIQSDTLQLAEVKILGSNIKSKSFIRSRLQLRVPGRYSIDQINNAVNRVYYSGFFKNISYDLMHRTDGYVLELRLTQRSSNLFRVGGHYDDYNRASLLLNVRLHNLVLEGSKTNLSFILGQNPAIFGEYMFDRGAKLGAALGASYSNRELRRYNENFTEVTSSFYYTFYNVDLYGYTNFVNNRRFSFGAKYEYFRTAANVNYIPDFTYSSSFFHLYGKYRIDYYDDGVYPTHGIRAQASATQMVSASNAPMLRIRGDVETALPFLSERFVIQPGVSFGAQFGDYKSYPYEFLIGGQNVGIYQNMVTFVGMEYTSYIAPYMFILRSNFRWNFKGKHYVFVLGQAGFIEHDIMDLFTMNKLNYGGALGYSLNSLIGPIDFSISTSSQGPNSHLLLAIGYWF